MKLSNLQYLWTPKNKCSRTQFWPKVIHTRELLNNKNEHLSHVSSIGHWSVQCLCICFHFLYMSMTCLANHTNLSCRYQTHQANQTNWKCYVIIRIKICWTYLNFHNVMHKMPIKQTPFLLSSGNHFFSVPFPPLSSPRIEMTKV